MFKGQTSSLYTLLGVLLVSVFALFLFTTQAGNQAQNLRTVSSADISYTTQLELRTIFNEEISAPNGNRIEMSDLIMYACAFGEESNQYKVEIMADEEIIIENPPKRLERHLNRTIGNNYRMTADCGSEDKEIVSGRKVPDNTQRLISSQIRIPLPSGNETGVILKRW